MPRIDPVALARELRDSECGGDATALFTARFDGFDWADARSVARARDELRLAEGDRLIGYKLGWTSAPMREALGIDRPNWGSLWASQVIAHTASAGGFRHAKVEPELVFRAAATIGAGATGSDISHGAGSWALGLEFVDPRFPGYEFDWLDNTADNSSCAAIVVGDFVEIDADPAAIEILVDDGAERRAGLGASAMGSPAAAVAWLASSLADEGARICAGDLVFTGGLAAPYDVRSGRTYSLTSSLLPPVRLTVR